MNRIFFFSVLLIAMGCSKEKSMFGGVSQHYEQLPKESELHYFRFNSSEMVKLAINVTTSSGMPAAKAKVGVYGVYDGKEYLLARGIADNWGMALVHVVKPTRLDQVVIKNLNSDKEVIQRIPKGNRQGLLVNL